MRTLAALVIIAALVSANAWAQADLDQATKVRDYYSEWLSSLPGVTGVDVGTSVETARRRPCNGDRRNRGRR